MLFRNMEHENNHNRRFCAGFTRCSYQAAAQRRVIGSSASEPSRECSKKLICGFCGSSSSAAGRAAPTSNNGRQTRAPATIRNWHAYIHNISVNRQRVLNRQISFSRQGFGKCTQITRISRARIKKKLQPSTQPQPCMFFAHQINYQLLTNRCIRIVSADPL